jgi:holo-[acyl-carrier protein] synthase
VRVGVDIIRTGRVRAAAKRWGDRLLCRILTDGEKLELRDKARAWRLASHWAAKEATAKVLRRSLLSVGLRSIELRHRHDGSPYLVLTGKAKEVAEENCIAALEVTISHDGDYVVAVVVGEERR